MKHVNRQLAQHLRRAYADERLWHAAIKDYYASHMFLCHFLEQKHVVLL